MGKLLGSFLREFSVAGGAEEMGIFKPRRQPPSGELLYLTPLAAARCRAVTREFRAEPCPTPRRSDVSMVAGHMSARDLLAD
jgi:hypothetical protein